MCNETPEKPLSVIGSAALMKEGLKKLSRVIAMVGKTIITDMHINHAIL